MNTLQEKIIRLISDNYDKGIFCSSIADKVIEDIERDLDLVLPESYKWYIKKYGCGGIGIDIYGVTKTDRKLVVEETLRYKNKGLPQNLVVIADVGEYIYCLDLRTKDREDCPIVSWSYYDKDGIVKTSNSFYKFLIDDIEDTIDNWDDD